MSRRILILICLATLLTTGRAQQNNLFEVSKNLEIYFSLFRELSLNYADDISPSRLTRTSIDAMLRSLDPYTNYIPEDQIEDFRFMTSGEFGGIGINTFERDKKTFISEIYENSPARQAGLKTGDRILSINTIDIDGKPEDDVNLLMKGEIGSVVNISYLRKGIEKPVSVDIRRQKISPPNVSYSGMVTPKTGLIRVEKFTEKAAEDVYNALLNLKKEKEFSSLIIDLRGNGGGLLDQAVGVVSLFTDKGSLVVSTKGRNPDRNRSYMTINPPVDTRLPLLIMVDESSASASEIVAGALQDFDRAVIMGEKTFGKGLVQNILPLPYNTQLKITVAKYYIPSGRCIQAMDYSDQETARHHRFADSLKSLFYTRGGRMVYDGGGIEPDLSPSTVQFKPLISSLFQNFIFFDFANEFALTHDSIPPPDQFVITPETYAGFIEFALSNYPKWNDEARVRIKALRNTLKEQGRMDTDKEKLLAGLENSLYADIEKEIAEARSEIEYILRIEIISRYYYQSGKINALIVSEEEIQEAARILEDSETYRQVLAGTHPDCHNKKRPK
jgi:carboxyl-terminal processing protease